MVLDKRKVHAFFDDPVAAGRVDQFIETGDCHPFTVVLHPTMVCNHACDFCNYFAVLEREMGAGARPTGRLETSDVLKLLVELRECGVARLIWSGGGEPLLHPDFQEMAREAVRLGFAVSLYSNLDLNLKPDMLTTLTGFEDVSVNVNTTAHRLYRATRGRHGDLERVKGNLRLLMECGVRVKAVVIVRDNTASAFPETIACLKELGVGEIVASAAFDLPYPDRIEASNAAMEALSDVAAQREWHGVRFLERVEPAVLDEKGRVLCRTSRFDITVGADYKVYPCCMTAYRRGYDIVDLRRYESFQEAWGSAERKNWLRSAELGCSTCWFAPANEVLRGLGDGFSGES